MTPVSKAPSPSKLATTAYYLSFVFMASGAMNYGVTAYFWAIPFAYYALAYAHRHFESRWPLIGVIVFMALGVLFNETIEKNPLVFPILTDGYLQELRPAASGSGSAAGELLGERLRVTGVIVGHPDFGTKVELIGSDGRTCVRDSHDQWFCYAATSGAPLKRSEFSFRASGPVESAVFKEAGNLMAYPWLPIVAFLAAKDALFPIRLKPA